MGSSPRGSAFSLHYAEEEKALEKDNKSYSLEVAQIHIKTSGFTVKWDYNFYLLLIFDLGFFLKGKKGETTDLSVD